MKNCSDVLKPLGHGKRISLHCRGVGPSAVRPRVTPQMVRKTRGDLSAHASARNGSDSRRAWWMQTAVRPWELRSACGPPLCESTIVGVNERPARAAAPQHAASLSLAISKFMCASHLHRLNLTLKRHAETSAGSRIRSMSITRLLQPLQAPATPGRSVVPRAPRPPPQSDDRLQLPRRTARYNNNQEHHVVEICQRCEKCEYAHGNMGVRS